MSVTALDKVMSSLATPPTHTQCSCPYEEADDVGHDVIVSLNLPYKSMQIRFGLQTLKLTCKTSVKYIYSMNVPKSLRFEVDPNKRPF